MSDIICPRCKNTGHEIFFTDMICGLCSGNFTKDTKFCPECQHPDYTFGDYGEGKCGSESSSGSMICGCKCPKFVTIHEYMENKK